jgi:hypothetical protein
MNMRVRTIGLSTAVLATVAFAAGCQGSATGTPGQGAAVVLHATLARDASASEAPGLTEKINDLKGVAYVDYHPGQGFTIGIDSRSDADSVKTWLHTESDIVNVSPGQ